MNQEDLSLDEICRTYALVETRLVPYCRDLASIKSNLDSVYAQWVNNDDIEKSKDNLGKLEKIATETLEESNGLLEKLKANFSGKKNNHISQIQEMFKKVEEADRILLGIQDNIRKSYNRQATALYEISENIRNAKRTVESLQSEIPTIEERVTNLYELHKEPEKLREHIKEIISKREDSQNISDQELPELIMHFATEGEEELKKQSRKYLEINHDLSLVGNFLQYETLVGNINSTASSFKSLLEKVSAQVSKIHLNIGLYQTITKNELIFLNGYKLPDSLIALINGLAQDMEVIDSKFSDKIMREVFVEDSKIRAPEFQSVIHGMINYVRENHENETK